jgi:hypothetical protein
MKTLFTIPLGGLLALSACTIALSACTNPGDPGSTTPCTDGDIQDGSTLCGLNNEGVLTQTCTAGAWVDNAANTCTGTDECVNDTSQDGSTLCEPEFLNWSHPNMTPDYQDLFNKPQDWTTALAGTHGFGMFINKVNDARDIDLAAQAEFLDSKGIGIAIEAGGTLNYAGCDDQNGESSAANELAKINHLIEVGGTLTYLTLDGPISRIKENGRNNNCGFTLEQSVRELMDYIRAVYEVLPDLKIGVLTNFPNWAYGRYPAYHGDVVNYGDYEVVLEAILSASEIEGLPIHYVVADNPWGYASGRLSSAPASGLDASQYDWLQRILDLETQVKSHGLPFALIYNSESGNSSGIEFAADVESYVQAYQAKGGSPDIRIVESWYSTPETALPESTEGSFTNAVMRAMSHYE